MNQMLQRVSDDASRHTALLPDGWPRPRGYVNGVKARGESIFVGGMVGWDVDGRFEDDFIAQARQALRNIAAVLATGGAGPEHLVRMTWYVVDIEEYRVSLKALGAAYREVMGSNYPAMTLVQVGSLVEPKARIEIEATAVLPDL